MTVRPHHERVDRTRNQIAFFLVGAFVGALVVFTFRGIPADNKDIITYMVGQLSGMATMALGYYFVNKIGQDQLDATRAESTGKMADAITSVAAGARPKLEDPDAPVPIEPAE